MKNKIFQLLILALLLAGYTPHHYAYASGEHAAHGAEEEFERGPHHGRMLRKDDFAVEITIFEDGVPPEYHVYVYENNKPVDPNKVKLGIVLSRLDGEVNDFTFSPQGNFLKGSDVVTEPH